MISLRRCRSGMSRLIAKGLLRRARNQKRQVSVLLSVRIKQYDTDGHDGRIVATTSRSCADGQVSALVHFVRPLLANRTACVGPLSDRLDSAAPLLHPGHRGRRSVGIDRSYCPASGSTAQEACLIARSDVRAFRTAEQRPAAGRPREELS
jgi:hypothetical protein